MLKKLRKFFVSGEEELITRLRQLIKYSILAINLLIDMNKEEISGNIDKLILLNEEISAIEKKGDVETLELTIFIMKGAVLPGFRSQLINLINTLDDILDIIHIMSREVLRVRRYSIMPDIQELKVLHNKIIEQLYHAKNMIIRLDELFNFIEKRWDNLVEISSSIEMLEEGGDALKEDSLDNLYIIKDKISWFLFDYYKNKIFRIDSIQDKCEDASNILMTILGQLIS